MSKYTEMTDDEIAVEIAKKLGYRVEFKKPSPKLRYHKWVPFNPDGTRSHLAPLPKNANPNNLYLIIGARYLRSVDEALELPRYGYRLGMLIGHVSEATFDDLARTFRATTDIDNPARAICEAWCQMIESDALPVADPVPGYDGYRLCPLQRADKGGREE